MTPFRNRADAGRQLAVRLSKYKGRSDVLVLALPRGGVPVAAEVAKTLAAPLDVFLVRKLGVPGHEELAMGAVAEGGIKVLTRSLIRDLAIARPIVEQVAVRERLEMTRRAEVFRGTRPPPEVSGRVVILIDDGLATGSTMEAAILALRERKPSRIIVAVPVGARTTVERLKQLVDELVVLDMPEPFFAVGAWYEDFSQTTDEEVIGIVAAAHRAVSIEVAPGIVLPGDLSIPSGASTLVLFAHGSGSSRHSPRNQFVARALQQRGLATLLIDLLTATEESGDLSSGRWRFDIRLLGRRLVGAIDWLSAEGSTSAMRVGLFGASTGAAAALVAAADRPARVSAVVSRGGRPDLAADALPRVTAPTLLIVGSRDQSVMTMNEEAMRQMRAPVQLEIVHAATHLFEEPGALEQVAALAAEWFISAKIALRSLDFPH